MTKKFYVENMEIKRGLDVSKFIPMVFDEKDIKDQTLGQVYHAAIRRRGVRVGDPCSTLVLKFPAQSEVLFVVDDKTINQLQDIASTGNIYFTKFPSCPREDFVTSVQKFLSEFELALKNEPPTATLADFFNKPDIREMFKLPAGCDFHVEFYDGQSYRLLGQIMCSEVPLREFGYFYGNHNYVIHIYDPRNIDLVRITNCILQGNWEMLMRYSSNSKIQGNTIPLKDRFAPFEYGILTNYVYAEILQPFITKINRADPNRAKPRIPSDFGSFTGEYPVLQNLAEKHEKSFNKDTIEVMHRDQLFTLTSSINQYLWRTELKRKAVTFLTEQGLTSDLICNYLNDSQSETKLAQIRKESRLKKEHWELMLHFLLREDVDNTPNAPLLGPQPFLDNIQQKNYLKIDPLRNVNKFDMINILLRDAFDRARRENAAGVPQAGCRYCDNKHDVEFHHNWPHAGIRLIDEHIQILEPLLPKVQTAKFQAAFDLPYREPSAIRNIVEVCKTKHNPTSDFLNYQSYPIENIKDAAGFNCVFRVKWR